MHGGSDDPAVISFLTLFEKLRNTIDDDPGSLEVLIVGDQELEDLCVAVADAALPLSLAEGEGELFEAPVNPAFLTAWREYEDRYSAVLAGIWLGDPKLKIDGPQTETERQKIRWENADCEAEEHANAIERVLKIADEQAAEGDALWSEDFSFLVRNGFDDWKRLARSGFSLRDVLRRRKLVPFVLIPRHVASRYGAEKISLYTHLKQAQDAFIFGVPYASVALMRSLLELLLERHYNGQSGAGDKGKIESLINTARLPKAVSRDRLHELRKLANVLLHMQVDRAGAIDGGVSELGIVSWLLDLRTLIESVPAPGNNKRSSYA